MNQQLDGAVALVPLGTLGLYPLDRGIADVQSQTAPVKERAGGPSAARDSNLCNAAWKRTAQATFRIR